ncbi:hypothetical protein [Thiovibrio frasassiensis]|uniref:Uncharacterized protein n=1 Tax=Thiovibrio frasassiensis TaxID=2984131 RepID=A0A9X4MK16_9BACT|nr:hypothetical protein [Thiovibrio frasassiensis]MDG4476269.1 hypothetical protein [Thiovibrio frasassiensis]
MAEQLADKVREEQLLKPGALDPAMPVNPYYIKHSFTFFGKYRVSHEWINLGGTCEYGSYFGKPKGVPLRIFDSLGSIYEEGGKVWWQSDKSYATVDKNGKVDRKDFDRYVRSVKVMNPVYGTPTKEELQASEKAQRERIERARRTGRYESDTPDIVKPIGYKEIETGLQTMCHQSWYATQHGLTVLLRKWSVDQYLAWLKKNSQQQGRVSHQRIGTNDWTVLEFNLEPQSTDGASSGPYQFWMLPIGDTGYTFLFRLGANLESLKDPDAHERFKATFRHLIESVNIEPLQP